MGEYDNICNYIHLPVQSGSDRILKLMNRLYSVEEYLKIINTSKLLLPDLGLSTDIITGFPDETEKDHELTLALIQDVKYDGAYTFAYSPRENTKSFKMEDNVPDEIKSRRLAEIIELQRKISLENYKLMIDRKKEILVESLSKKSKEFVMGRTDCNKSVIVEKNDFKIGDKIMVMIDRVNSATLFGKIA